MKRLFGTEMLLASLSVMILTLCSLASADAPLPLQMVEGNSGVLLTPTAYLANPPKEGDAFGLPSVSAATGFMRHKDFEAFGITQNLWGRVEIGYAFERLGLGDWTDDVESATGGLHVKNHVMLHNFNLRYMAVQEGDFDITWMPAITIGTHFKWNENVDKIDSQLGGLLDMHGVDNHLGVEFTATGSKTIKDILPKPIIISAGLRNSDAIHTGLLGFAGERSTTIEGSIIYFLTDRLCFAAEYRQKPDFANQITAGGKHLLKAENDWYDLLLAYVVNDNLTVAGGYVNWGNILNHRESNGWALQLKYEF
ncbi:DUF3034 family protein [Planctomycetota bacterium]